MRYIDKATLRSCDVLERQGDETHDQGGCLKLPFPRFVGATKEAQDPPPTSVVSSVRGGEVFGLREWLKGRVHYIWTSHSIKHK